MTTKEGEDYTLELIGLFCGEPLIKGPRDDANVIISRALRAAAAVDSFCIFSLLNHRCFIANRSTNNNERLSLGRENLNAFFFAVSLSLSRTRGYFGFINCENKMRAFYLWGACWQGRRGGGLITWEFIDFTLIAGLSRPIEISIIFRHYVSTIQILYILVSSSAIH